MVAFLLAVPLFNQIRTWNALPSCDEKRTKDSLSKIFKERKSEIAFYDEIDTVEKTDTEIRCKATLTFFDNKKLVIEYTLLNGSEGNRILVTIP